MAAVTRLSKISPEISEAVMAEQRLIVAEISRFNEMKADDPRFYDVQLQLRTRFSYWHRAWWTVHRLTGVDGRAPVQEILELSLIRSNDTTLNDIVIDARAHLDGIKSTPAKTP